MAHPVRLEIVCTSFDDAVVALENGADRLELCAELGCGGVTPGPGFVRQVRSAFPDADLRLLLRGRGGSFELRRHEGETLLHEIAAARELGVRGVVIGALDASGALDREALRRFRDAAGPLEITFHRAFDLVVDKERALECLVDHGIERVLTSGGPATAWEGRETLRALVQRAADRIVVLPGGGVRANHAAALLAATGARELHSSARLDAGHADGGHVDAAEVRALSR